VFTKPYRQQEQGRGAYGLRVGRRAGGRAKVRRDWRFGGQAAEEQSASGGEGGSKISGRHVDKMDGSGAETCKESTTRRNAGVGE
jgi:hypothetical protein